ncbi:hypothetical protein Dimus_034629 [Dionaea muscipula]
MMIQFMDQHGVNCLDSQLWHACAGGMIQMPRVNARVFYFVQGHIEHASSGGNINFRSFPRIPPYVLCKVEGIKYLADRESDEVYARIRLSPATSNEPDYGNYEDDGGFKGSEFDQENKPASFAKTLTQSDANNGGGFSVPRYCAETIFPRLDYTADPPVQNIVAKDVHGEPWKFRHIYRGTPRRHLLTTGWSTFVNAKKLVAGDSIVFMRTEKGDLCVGIRRVKRGGQVPSSGWSPESSFIQYPPGLSALLKEDNNDHHNSFTRNNNAAAANSSIIISSSGGGGSRFKGNATVESVVEAASRAADGQPFEVIYYPRAGTPEFVVRAALVKSALQVRWFPGMRFKMPFETEDSSRISWFMGTITAVQVSDPSRWPQSPWRLLQVNWDEPDLLQNVKRVSPWLVEIVSSTMPPSIHLPPFSPPRKKLRLPQHEYPDHFPPLDGGQLQMPIGNFNFNFLGYTNINPFGYLPDPNSPAGMQGARHAQFGLTSLPDLRFNKLQLSGGGLFPCGNFPATAEPAHAAAQLLTRRSTFTSFNVQQNYPSSCTDSSTHHTSSCFLTLGNSISPQTTTPNKSQDHSKRPNSLILFGKSIHLTEEEQIMYSQSRSGDTAVAQTGRNNSSSDVNQNGGQPERISQSQRCMSKEEEEEDDNKEVDSELAELGCCKVFMESEDVGRILDLSLLTSYEELCSRLVEMFGLELEGDPDDDDNNNMLLNRVIYRDHAGFAKRIGKEPFSEFAKNTKRLTILHAGF